MTALAEISVMTVFMYTGILSTATPQFPDWLQYGAFGLCCVMVLYLLWYVKEMGKVIREKDKKYIELLERDIESRNRLTQMLKDRPCVHHDHRA